MIQILYIGNDHHLIESIINSGAQVVVLKSPMLAEKWLDKGGKPDTVLCEFEVPGSNAINFFRFFRKKYGAQHRIPLLVIGGRLSSDEIKKALQMGIDDIFPVTVQADRVIKRIQRLIELKKLFKTSSVGNAPDITCEPYRIPFIKRAFDIVAALSALILLSPLFLIIMAAIKLESKGSVFYLSKRVGTGYKIFSFYKFRSMYQDADKHVKELSHLNQYTSSSEPSGSGQEDLSGDIVLTHDFNSPFLIGDEAVISEDNYLKTKKEEKATTFVKFEKDPRTTKVGRIIRKLSIDELPQLVNVLKGDMSIVGNRPLPLYEAELLTTDEWSERFLGPAGITGLWQVKARGKSKKMSPEERKELDNKYVQIAQSPYSFFIDLWLIIRTIPAIFQKENV